MTLRWVVFDMNGTLLDPGTIDRALGRAGDGAVARVALRRAVTHAMALTLAGGYRPFAEILEAALANEGLDGDRLREAMGAAARLEPYPQAEGALEALAAADLGVAVLTNTARASAEENLTAVGLRGRVAEVIGTDEVEAFKPDQRVYRHATSRLGSQPSECCLVSAHDWDLLGAASAGLRTAWVAREGRPPLGTVPEPEFRGDDLLTVAEALAASA